MFKFIDEYRSDIAYADLPPLKDKDHIDYYYHFKGYIKQISDLEGQVVDIDDLPMTNKFYDFEYPSYKINNNIITLTLKKEGPNFGRAGGASTIDIQDLARIYISGENGEQIIDYCGRCGFKYSS
jgi:hypothetical protein